MVITLYLLPPASLLRSSHKQSMLAAGPRTRACTPVVRDVGAAPTERRGASVRASSVRTLLASDTHRRHAATAQRHERERDRATRRSTRPCGILGACCSRLSRRLAAGALAGPASPRFSGPAGSARRLWLASRDSGSRLWSNCRRAQISVSKHGIYSSEITVCKNLQRSAD